MNFLNLLILPLEGALLLLVSYFVVNEIIRWRSRIKGLPGPKGLPVVGNLPQVRSKRLSSMLVFPVTIY